MLLWYELIYILFFPIPQIFFWITLSAVLNLRGEYLLVISEDFYFYFLFSNLFNVGFT